MCCPHNLGRFKLGEVIFILLGNDRIKIPAIPSIVGENGVETVLEIPLDEKEHQALLSSAQQLKEVIATLDLP